MSREAQKLIKQISEATNFVFHVLLSYDPLTRNFGSEEALMLSTCMNSTIHVTLLYTRHKKSNKRRNKQALVSKRKHQFKELVYLLAQKSYLNGCLFMQNHIINEMSGRQDDSPPSPRDVRIIALEAELEEYRQRDLKTNQIINELTRKSRDLETEVCFVQFISYVIICKDSAQCNLHTAQSLT